MSRLQSRAQREAAASYQYAEGLRRGLDHCVHVTSTNDGAPWIERVTRLNFPDVPQIIDWSHAAQHVWTVANAVQGEQTPAAQRWANTQLDALWNGQVAEVVQTLEQTCIWNKRPIHRSCIKRPTTFVCGKSRCNMTSSVPKAGPSAVAWWKAPPTPSSIIA